MMYVLKDLLIKMGAPDVEARQPLRWQYFCDRGQTAGFAEVALIEKGERLVAELRHVHENYEDEDGSFHPTYTETFYLHALRRGSLYQVTKVAFDGDEYTHPEANVVELALSLFHARALSISIRMVEQAFNKEDILAETAAAPGVRFQHVPVRKKTTVRAASWGVVVPFPAARARRAPARAGL